MTRYFLALTFLLFCLQTFSQQLISAVKIGSFTKGDIILKGYFSAEYGADIYHITYNTTDPHGAPIIASGALAIPVGAACDSLPMANYNHGTVLHKENVPSRMTGEEFVGLALASRGFVTSMPDYLGLGDSPGLHPYQHAASEASATLDMIRSCRKFIADSTDALLNGELFLTGYSQGGHAAMATHKHIQENTLEAEFNVIASAPCSGAYDMSGTTASFIFNNAYSNPGYIVYIIEAFQEVYGNIYTSRDKIYKPPYHNVVVPYLSGDSTMDALNAVLKPRVDSLLRDSVLANFISNPNHPIRVALEDNDVYNWAPEIRVEMNYCEADEQVPYQNSLYTLDTMMALGATDVTAVSRGASFNHGACAIPSLTAALELFLSMTNSCLTIGIAEQDRQAQFDLYPNPAKNEFVLECYGNNSRGQLVSIYSPDGRKIEEITVKEVKNKLDISKYPKGTYFVQLIAPSGQHAVKKLIVQ